MKHIFVINPISGKGMDKQPLIDSINALKGRYDVEIYMTQGPKDATRFVREYCKAHAGDAVHFIACGGDGTLNEVANGAVGFEGIAIGAYPCGSGNDYIKYYGGKDKFSNVEDIVEGTEAPIDVIKVGDRYAINACHFGFDSYVCLKMDEFRHTKRNPYPSAVLWTLMHGMRNKAKVVLDDGEEAFVDGDYLMCTMCNGSHVGGSYNSAPRSMNDDGLLEICLIKPVSRLRFISCMGLYEKGEHLSSPRMSDIVKYTRARKAVIDVPAGFGISLDGELLIQSHVEVENLQHALRFVVPRGAEHIAK